MSPTMTASLLRHNGNYGSYSQGKQSPKEISNQAAAENRQLWCRRDVADWTVPRDRHLPRHLADSTV